MTIPSGFLDPTLGFFLARTSGFLCPNLGFSLPDLRVFLCPTLGFFSARPSGFSRPDPWAFLSPNLGFSRPDLRVLLAQPLGFLDPNLWFFSSRPSGFSRPDPLVFLGPTLWFFSARPSGFSQHDLVFLGLAWRLLAGRCPSLRVYSSHACLCGHAVRCSSPCSYLSWAVVPLPSASRNYSDFLASDFMCSPLHGFFMASFPRSFSTTVSASSAFHHLLATGHCGGASSSRGTFGFLKEGYSYYLGEAVV